MKKTYTILLTLILIGFNTQSVFSQFVIAQDTIRGSIDFCERAGDLKNAVSIPNDSVFYMFPPDLDIDPWRYVHHYTPARDVETGYIKGTKLMRVDDYDIVEVERLSPSSNTITFKNDDIRATVTVGEMPAKNSPVKRSAGGIYTINGKEVKGATQWVSPKKQYRSISVSVNGRNIVFPKKVYENLLEPDIEDMVLYHNPKTKTVYIQANNGGRDAFYTVLWIVTPRGVSNPYIFDPALKR